MRDIVNSDNALTLTGIGEAVQTAHGVSLSPSTVKRRLRTAKITRKRLKKVPEKRNSNRVTEARFTYAVQMLSIENQRLVFLDETGVNLHTSGSYGHYPEGIDAYITVLGNRGRNQSVLPAITLNGSASARIFDGAVNRMGLKAFLVD